MKVRNLIISVFKTNILERDLVTLKPVLDKFSGIDKWSVDLEDCENILRVESQYSIEQQIITMLLSLNVSCIELH